MATGDQIDITNRLQALIPASWFPGALAPIYTALLSGLANAHAFIYSLLAYVRLQTRIATATDAFLDLIAWDYFGAALTRATNQSDASFRAAILVALLRERGTRKSVVQVLTQLTGRTPVIFEPERPADTGAYRGPSLGYGVAGGYGSLLLPFQAFVTAYRPAGTGIPNVAGYGVSTGGYGDASQAEYASLAMVQGAVTDAAIYAAIDSVRPAGSILWTHISN